MKRHLLALLSCVLLLVAVTGCKDKNTTPQSLKGNEARPTWTAPDEYDYSSSMTAVIRVDLAAQYPTQAADFTIHEDDLLAAFAEGKMEWTYSSTKRHIQNTDAHNDKRDVKGVFTKS